MNGPDVSRLAPGDAVAALRSFPRRFRSVLHLVDDDDPSALERPGPDGISAAEHAARAGRDLVVVGGAVRRVLEEEAAVLHPAVTDPAARRDAHEPVAPVEAALDLLELEALALADRAATVAPADWGRTAAVDGGGQVAALDLLREAVRSVAAHLLGAERARFEGERGG